MTQDTTSTLNDVIEILKDGQEGFRTASEDVDNSQLKSLFSEFSLQRAKFAGELQSLARSLGESNPDDADIGCESLTVPVLSLNGGAVP